MAREVLATGASMDAEGTPPEAECPTPQGSGELVLAILPSRVAARNDPGHAWLEWSPGEGPHPPCRGYWPDLNDPDLPDDCVPGSRELHRWLRVHSVRGLRTVDHGAARKRRERPAVISEWRAPLAPDQAALVEARCWIPPDVEAVVEGRYSWNEERDDWDNCSSWALRVAREIVGDRVPHCDRPKKLSAVIAAVSRATEHDRRREEG